METVVDSMRHKKKEIPIYITDDITGLEIKPLAAFRKKVDKLGRASLGIDLAGREVVIVVLPLPPRRSEKEIYEWKVLRGRIDPGNPHREG